MREMASAMSIRNPVRIAYSGKLEGASEIGVCVRVASGWTSDRLASANSTMKPSTSAAASTSHRLGRTRRAWIETGGRIFISGMPRGFKETGDWLARPCGIRRNVGGEDHIQVQRLIASHPVDPELQ